APRRGRLARCRGGRVCVGRVGRLGESDGRATRGGGAWALTGDRPSRRPDGPPAGWGLAARPNVPAAAGRVRAGPKPGAKFLPGRSGLVGRVERSETGLK